MLLDFSWPHRGDRISLLSRLLRTQCICLGQIWGLMDLGEAVSAMARLPREWLWQHYWVWAWDPQGSGEGTMQPC